MSPDLFVTYVPDRSVHISEERAKATDSHSGLDPSYSPQLSFIKNRIGLPERAPAAMILIVRRLISGETV